MNDNWKQENLGDITNLFNGKAIKAEKDGNYPVYGSNGVIGRSNKFSFNNAIIIGRVGAYCGSVEYSNDFFWATDNTIVLKQKNGRTTIIKFLYYLLKSLKLNRYAGGSAQPLMTQNVLKRVPIKLPSYYLQKKIALILSAYDDLIENNNRRIEILEEMAQVIYKEWFVHFRFPGYEKVKMVDSELGKIPEGWEVVEVGKKFSTLLGGTPSRIKDEYWTGGNVPWINSGKVNELRVINESEFITELGLRKSSTKMMPKRTTVVAITGATLGQVSLLEIEACANQSVVGIQDTEHLFDEYIYFKFCEIIRSVILKSSGGAQQHINKEIVNSEKILTPSVNIILEFNKVIRPMCNLIRNLLIKNKILKNKRDLLLPKLISGEIDVSDLDIKTEDDIK